MYGGELKRKRGVVTSSGIWLLLREGQEYIKVDVKGVAAVMIH